MIDVCAALRNINYPIVTVKRRGSNQLRAIINVIAAAWHRVVLSLRAQSNRIVAYFYLVRDEIFSRGKFDDIVGRARIDAVLDRSRSVIRRTVERRQR
jgi:hypothetical protein